MFNDSELIFEHCRRIYAVTMKNIPITVGFAVIAAAQLAIGVCLVTFAAEGGSKVKLLIRRNHISLRASVRRSIAPTDTP